MKAVKISKICLEIDGQKIELTLKQAQALKDALNDTFGKEVTRYVYPYYHYLAQPCTTWASNNLIVSDNVSYMTNTVDMDMVTSAATASLMGNQLSFSVS